MGGANVNLEEYGSGSREVSTSEVQAGNAQETSTDVSKTEGDV